jgi:hypothetical protein
VFIRNGASILSGSAYAVNISANVGYGTYGNGNVTQFAGSSIIGSDGVSIVAGGSVSLGGIVTASTGTLFVQAGYQSNYFEGDAYGVTPDGGNIHLGPNSSIVGGAVDLVAHGVSLSNGDIVQDAGGTITITGGYSNSFKADGNLHLDGSVSLAYSGGGNLNAYGGYSGASGKMLEVASISSLYGGSYIGLEATGDASIGSVYAPGGTVYVQAGSAILRSASNLNGINIVADSVTLTSVNGGLSDGIAISAFVEAANSITANVNVGASYGGISIANFGAQPSAVSLIDDAFYPGSGLNSQPMSIAFYNSGDLLVDAPTVFSTSNSGDMSITSGGNLNYISGLASIDGNLLLGANGNLAISTSLSTVGDLKLGAGGVLDVSWSLGGYNVELAAPTININAAVTANNNAALIAPLAGGTINLNAGVTASGTSATPSTINGIAYSGIAIIAQDVVADGSSAYLNTTTSTGDISGLVSGNITLTNGASFQAGNDIDLVLAGSTSTLSLSTGSYFLADYATLIPATIKLDFTGRSSGGIVIDGVETTKTVVGGSGFFVVNSSTPATEGFGLEIKHASTSTTDICAISPNLCKPPPPNENPIDDDAPPPFSKPDPDKKATCTEGTFGCDEEKKDKQDQANDGKKDEKPGEKKVAQCSL